MREKNACIAQKTISSFQPHNPPAHKFILKGGVRRKEQEANKKNLKAKENGMKEKIITGTLKTVLMILSVSFIISSLSFAEKSDSKFPININQATVKELSALPGIAKKKAEAIIAYREKNGKFSTIEDIKKVEGIGKDIFEKIKDHIVLE